MTDKKEKKEEEKKEEMQTYELGYLFIPLVLESNLEEEVSRVRDTLEKLSDVVSSKSPESRDLAYRITKVVSGKKQIFEKAYLGSFIFDSSPSSLGALKKELELNEHILRFLLMKRTKESLIPEEPRVIPTVAKKDADDDSASGVLKSKEQAHTVIDETELDKTIEELVVT